MDQISHAGAAEGAPEFDRSLKRRTVTSIAWTMGQAAGDQLFSFLVFVLLARLLDKDAIGTFAIAFVFMDIGRNLATTGVMQRIARTHTPTPRELDTIFWTNIAIAVAYSAAIIAAAPAAARAFGAPDLRSVLVWLTIPVLLSAAGNTHMALRLREFGHRTLAVRSVVAGLLGGGVAVIAALLGAGIWALVLQRLVREFVCSALAWSSYRWRPRFTFDLRDGRTYLRQALELGFAQVVTLLSYRAQDLQIARAMGPAPLSSYRIAWRCAELIGPQIVGPFGTVALQTFSRLEHAPAELRRAYVAMLQQCALVSIPALVGYSVAGPWLVPALFGPQWKDAGAVAPMLLPLALPFTISGFVLALLAAKGQVTWQRQLSLVDLASTIVVTAVAIPYGLRIIALAYGIRALCMIPLQLHFVRKASGINFQDHLQALAKPCAAAAAMGVAAALLFTWVRPSSLFVIVGLCAAAAAFYAVLAAALLPNYRKVLQQLVAC